MIATVIQARLNSTRLPAKVMLSIGGLPITVLAAKRASNRGVPVRVATSDEKTDDILAQALQRDGIVTVRGPLNDVLSRFVLATGDLPDDSVVVRLTADNVFPDGRFIEELVEALQQSGGDYLGTASPADGLPYGMSAEAFRVSALRAADNQATSPFDREHVTPWIRRRFTGEPFRPKALRRDLSHLRCTIDNLDDYERVARLFDGIADPVNASWEELCERLADTAPSAQMPMRIVGGRPASVLTLGTAQLGIPNYGRANASGRPRPSVAIQLVREAVSCGITCVDTARAYESAERVIGEALKPYGDRIRVVTKLAPLDKLPDAAPIEQVRQAVDASIFRSCRELGMARLPILLLHRWKHRTSHQGTIWNHLLELKADGVIDSLGISVSTPVEAAEALADPEIRHLQIPFNLLDHRWLAAGMDTLAARRTDVVIHARSVLLQGILAASPALWPGVAGISPDSLVTHLDKLAQKLGRVSRLDLCLAFVRAQPWIHSLVVGAETSAQLRDLIGWFQRPPLAFAEVAEVRQNLPEMPDALLDPARWPSS